MYLDDNVQQALRQMNKIAVNEVLKKEGDLFVAVNVETQQRRIVQIDQSLVESLAKGQRPPGSGRGLLKG
jgi:hypothetical protein|tara:strand:+ start:82 stop:291 length:210 start_codon:yes stop_codon:yes gene_type:complete